MHGADVRRPCFGGLGGDEARELAWVRIDEVFGFFVGGGTAGDEVDVCDAGEVEEGVDDVGALGWSVSV